MGDLASRRAILRAAAATGTCPECEGTGRPYQHPDGWLLGAINGCPFCAGTGVAGEGARRQVGGFDGLLKLALELDALVVEVPPCR